MHFKPKKSLGQNFLFDKNIQTKIITACGLKSSDTVLEIGPGSGQLTRLIADKVNKIYAIELDSRLSENMEKEFKDYANIKIINQDILKVDLKTLFNRNAEIPGFQGFSPESFIKKPERIKVIGNIPYYITTPIIEHLFNFKEMFDAVFITVQKEFARRIAACPGSKDYGSFSCFVQYYALPKILFFIKKTSFFPRPKVDSCFLRLAIRREPEVKANDEKMLFKIIMSAFSKRRKTLKNSLKGIIPQDVLDTFFIKYNISSKSRPEDLCLKDFIGLSHLVLFSSPGSIL